MHESKKIGIIICDRYSNCAGGKCFRALRNREGAFDIYPKDTEVELRAYTTCGGCPGGNFEYAPEEMKKNGVDTVHLATGFIVGYPPCPYIKQFIELLTIKFGLNVVVGTHPIPEKYISDHTQMKTWESPEFKSYIKPTMSEKEIRIAYN